MAGYQLKIIIEYTKPPVWRRMIVPDNITFEDLHRVIQEAFGWENMHLHDFSFPDNQGPRIGPKEGMDHFFSDDLDETQTYLDEYIKDYTWIRYTYDFGDEWRHKIILEKELPDYKERYSQIVKYKGNNFAEDSGGIWEGEIISDIFDMENANIRLKKLVFEQTKRKKKKKEKNPFSFLETKLFDDMLPENFLMAMNEIVNNKKDQLDDDTIKLWEKTLNDFKTLINTGPRIIDRKKTLLETKIEQIGLLYYEEETFSFGGTRMKIKKAISKRSQKEILMDFQKDELWENMSSLGIYFAKSWKKEKLTEKMAESLQEHGEYLYYLLNKQEVSDFLQFFHAPKGNYQGKLSAISLKNLVWWGYMDIAYSERGNSITLLMPKEVEELFKKIEETNWRKICENIEKTAEEIHRLMQYYGCIEIEKLYLKYTQALRQIEKEEFSKYLYFAVDGHDLSWIIRYREADYICLTDLNIETIINCQEKMVQDLDYPNLTKLDVERWKKGLRTVYPEWAEFVQYLNSFYEFSQEEMEEVIGMELYPSLLEGNSLEELVEILAEWISIETLEEWVQIWKYLHKIFLHTRIAGLKGYTREEVAKRKGVNPFTIAVELEEKKQMEVSTHLHKTPLEYQNKISEIIDKLQDSPKKAAKELEELMVRYHREHYESRILLAEFYDMDQQWEKAQKELEEVFKENPEDESLEELLELGKMEMRKVTLAEPFQRKEKKIGRNNLCPCGSGKKYKFCCGKNK